MGFRSCLQRLRGRADTNEVDVGVFQVRRMLGAVHLKCVALERVQIGAAHLPLATEQEGSRH